jgi:T5SS/PEP-CTERM-associated repeat protein
MTRNFRIAIYTLAMVTGLMAGHESAFAVNAIATGNWSGAGTWNPAEPVAGDSATIDGGLTVTLDQTGEAAGTVDVGTVSGETGNLSVAAPGAITISGGGLASIRVGQGAGATGNLTMTGGTVAVSGGTGGGFAIGDIMVGDLGSGTITQSGGDLTASDEIIIANSAASVGSVSVSGGNFRANGRSLLVGFGGNGTLNVSGTGAVRANFDMLVGFLAGSTAAVNLSGGTIDANFMFTNFDNPGTTGGTVTMTQTGGTFTAHLAYVMGRGPGTTTLTHSAGAIICTEGPGDMVVSDGGGNTSTYNVSGTAVVTLSHDVILGTFEGANGTVNQSGGAITAANNLRIGADGTGHWNLSGGTVNAKNVFLGDFDTSNGTMKVSGGTLGLSGNLSVGGALASNAPASPTGTQGQAVDANGTFVVSGSGGTINVAGQLLANPGDHNRALPGTPGDNVSILNWEVLNNSGVSRMNVTGAANLNAAIIDVDILGGSFSVGSSFDLLTAASISSNFVEAAEDVGVFNLSIVPGGNGQILRATLVPEPGTLMMLCLAATGWSCGWRKVRAAG